MPNDISILITLITFLSFTSMAIVANSWYIHFIVKDGLARKILLWANAMIFLMMLFLFVGGTLSLTGILTLRDSMVINGFSIFFIYVIVFGQQWMQRGRAERNEGDSNEADRIELKERRKKY